MQSILLGAVVEHHSLLLVQVGCGEVLICNMVLLVLHVYSHSPLKVIGNKNVGWT